MLTNKYFILKGKFVVLLVLVLSVTGCCSGSGLDFLGAILLQDTEDTNNQNMMPSINDMICADCVKIQGIITSPTDKHHPKAEVRVFLSTNEHPNWNDCIEGDCEQYQADYTLTNYSDTFFLRVKGIKTANLKENEDFKIRIYRNFASVEHNIEAFAKEWSFEELGIQLTKLDTTITVNLELL